MLHDSNWRSLSSLTKGGRGKGESRTMAADTEQLKAEVKRLKNEVRLREEDLQRYRTELESANQVLESMIASLNRDIKAMVKLQRALVPTEYPHITGFSFSTKFIPSKVSGGDYLEIFEHDNRLKFGMVLSSANNYGMSALLLSAFLNFTGQLEARKGAPPQEMAKKIIDETLQEAAEKDSASLFYSTVDMKTMELHYSLSGAILGFILEPGGEIRYLEATEEAVSLEQNFKGNKNVIQLNPKERVILCSPGVIEAQNLEDEVFGLSRLLQAIKEGSQRSIHEQRNEILFQLEQFAQGVEPRRDRSVVVGEVHNRVLKLAKS